MIIVVDHPPAMSLTINCDSADPSGLNPVDTGEAGTNKIQVIYVFASSLAFYIYSRIIIYNNHPKIGMFLNGLSAPKINPSPSYT